MYINIQLTIAQHGFELRGYTYTWIFYSPIYVRTGLYTVLYMYTLIPGFFLQQSTINVFSLPHDVLSNIFFSLDYFIIRIQHIMHVTYKICVNQLFILLVRLLVNSSLSVVKFGGVKSYVQISDSGLGHQCT